MGLHQADALEGQTGPDVQGPEGEPTGAHRREEARFPRPQTAAGRRGQKEPPGHDEDDQTEEGRPRAQVAAGQSGFGPASGHLLECVHTSFAVH